MKTSNNNSVMQIGVELYRNPTLSELMERVKGLNDKDIHILTEVTKIFEEGGGKTNETAKQLLEESAGQEYIEEFTKSLKAFNQSIQQVSEQLEYLVEILE